jgi:hypothetical protein
MVTNDKPTNTLINKECAAHTGFIIIILTHKYVDEGDEKSILALVRAF